MGSNIENEPGDNSQNGKGEDRAKLSTTRLVEGVRDFFLTQLKQHHLQKPWPQMNENDQRLWIERITDRAEKLVDDVIEHVTHGDFPVVNAKVDSFTVKAGEVKIVAKGFADNEILATLNDAGEKRVQITVMRNDQFDQGRDPLNPDPDQPGLPGVKGRFADDEDTPDPLPPEEPEVENPDGEQEEGEEALKPKSDEWRGGFNSRMGGHYRNENPFNPATQMEAFTDWHAGWDAGDFDDKAPKLGEQKKSDAANKNHDAGKAAFAEGVALADNPFKRNPAKDDWEKGWLSASSAARKADGPEREPDIEPEDEAPAAEEPEIEDADTDEITDHNGDPITNEEEAYAYGAWCRADGKGTGSNPFEPGSDFGKQWLRGYSDQRKKETEEF